MLIYSVYVTHVDCVTTVAAFTNSKKWAGYSVISPTFKLINAWLALNRTTASLKTTKIILELLKD